MKWLKIKNTPVWKFFQQLVIGSLIAFSLVLTPLQVEASKAFEFSVNAVEEDKKGTKGHLYHAT